MKGEKGHHFCSCSAVVFVKGFARVMRCWNLLSFATNESWVQIVLLPAAPDNSADTESKKKKVRKEEDNSTKEKRKKKKEKKKKKVLLLVTL